MIKKNAIGGDLPVISKSEISIEKVVQSKTCIGCGTCAGIHPLNYRMVENEDGEYIPEVISRSVDVHSSFKDGSSPIAVSVCPFSGVGPDEDEIAEDLFSKHDGIRHRTETGYYLEAFAAHVTDEEARLASTSGGIISWLTTRLLQTGEVDAIACVSPSTEEGRLFDYSLISDPEELRKCRKSRYYPVEISRILPRILESDKRVAFVGLPCFVKALNLAMREEPALRTRIAYTIGLVCGHLKTKKYAAYLARHCGIIESEISSLDFRVKVPGRPANKYDFRVVTGDGEKIQAKQLSTSMAWANSWGNNLFMIEACESCDDVFAETADVVIGDAWLPEFARDYRGESVVLCRNPVLMKHIADGKKSGEIAVEQLPIGRLIASQAAGLRQRRVGLQYRLALAMRRGQWLPRKRVRPDIKAGTLLFRILQRLRMRLTRYSKAAFLRQEKLGVGLRHFKRDLFPIVLVVGSINFFRHLPNYFKRIIEILRKRVSSIFE